MSESSERIDGGRARRRTGHEEVWDLLPWYVNETLEQGELRTVEGHLQDCGICREELRYWRGFAGALQEEGDLAVSADAGLARLRRRLAGSGALTGPSAGRAPHRGPASSWERPRRWLAGLRAAPGPLRWALAAQLAAILLLGGLLASVRGGLETATSEAAPPAAAGEFRTLSDAPAPAAAAGSGLLRVVFADQAREREIRGALIAVGGRIVDGPSPTGVYTVAVDGAGGGGAVESLRSFSQVVFAERAAASAEAP